MFDKLDDEDFRYLLVNSREAISYILDVLDDKDALDILAYLHYEPASFKALNTFFDKIDKNTLSSYITRLWDFGIVKYTKKEEFELTKLRYKMRKCRRFLLKE